MLLGNFFQWSVKRYHTYVNRFIDQYGRNIDTENRFFDQAEVFGRPMKKKESIVIKFVT